MVLFLRPKTMTQTPNTPVIFLKQSAVSARTALPKSSLYALIAKGDFPKPVKLTEKAVAWSSAAVDQWIAARIAAGAMA